MITLCVYRDVSGMFTTESRLGGVRDELGGRGGPEAEGQGAETRCVRAGPGAEIRCASVQGRWGGEGRPRPCAYDL